MDPQQLEDLAALALAYRDAKRASRKALVIATDDDVDDANKAIAKAAHELLAFAAEVE